MTTLSKLKELMSIPGVIAAGEFSNDGRLLAYYGNIDERSAEIAAMMCTTNKLMYNGQCGVFVEIDKADFDKAFEVLSKYI